jgi:hypothetical protein
MPAQLAFAKLTTPAKDTSWSISYNAGSLFAAIAITLESESDKTPAEIGKSFISGLEAEFFSLEEKSYSTIKSAISTALSEIPKTVTVSAAFAYNKDGFVYIYALGKARIMLQRKGRLGVLLINEAEDLGGASGILQTGDILLLGTQTFFTMISSSQLEEALSLQLPSDMAESLSPSMQDKTAGTEAALFLAYTGETQAFEPKEATGVISSPGNSTNAPKPHHHFPSLFHHNDTPETPTTQAPTEEPFHPSRDSLTPSQETPDTEPDDSVSVTSSSLKTFVSGLVHSKFLFIGLAFLVFFIIVGIIYQTKQNDYNKQVQAIFSENYKAAQKDYDEGESLYTLNKTLAHDDYLSAKNRLVSIQGKLKSDSPEAKQLTELLDKVNARLTDTGTVSSLSAVQKQDSDSPLLATLAQKSPLAITEDTTSLYLLKSDSVTKIDKSSKKETTIIKNDTDWDQAVSIAIYLSNIYILDQTTGILKYTPTSSGFAKTSYFKDGQKTTGTQTSMTIDGSIWILGKDGKISKFTKGTQDAFSVSGLQTLPTNPSKIHTTVDSSVLYVLDQQNSQILLFTKSGALGSSLVAPQLKNATEFTVDEKNKVILFLSDKKIYQISLP